MCQFYYYYQFSHKNPRQAAEEVPPPNTFHLASTRGHCALVEGGWDLSARETPAITWPPWPTLFWAIQFSAGHLGYLGSSHWLDTGLRPPLTSLSSLFPLGSSCPLTPRPGSLPDMPIPAERKGAKPSSRGGTATTQGIVFRSGC